jgi:hypothetical protein
MANAYGILRKADGSTVIMEDKLRKADGSEVVDMNNNLRKADGSQVQVFFTAADGGIPADPVDASGLRDDSFFISDNERIFQSRNERVFKS